MKIEIEKPVIPQFVAEWIENEKRRATFHKSMSRAINLVLHDEEWKQWELDLGNRWSRDLATAWLHGYEVEQPLYYAKIKGWEKSNDSLIYWNFEKHVSERQLSINSKGQMNGFETQMTKAEWSALGINGTNADFEEVE